MSFLEVIGILCILYLGIRFLFLISKLFYRYVIRAQFRKTILTSQSGRWAVITGATDGIGKAYAKALASLKINVVLISRDIKKLNTCAVEIENRYEVETKVIAIDFTKGMEIYEEIEFHLAGLEIGVLVNNIGLSYTYPELFLNIPDKNKFITSIIRANIIAITKMCDIVMPGMVERKTGVVINISSASAVIPAPMLTIYSATKRYIEKFSDDLRSEYERDDILIQTVLPGYVATKMSKIRKSSWLVPSAEIYVDKALGTVGVLDHTTGYFPHTLFVFAIQFLQSICKPLAIYIVLRSMKSVRARAVSSLKKKANLTESICCPICIEDADNKLSRRSANEEISESSLTSIIP